MEQRERDIAIRESVVLSISDEYFAARPHVDNVASRNMFEAGAERMYARLNAEHAKEKEAGYKLTFLEEYVIARASRVSEGIRADLIVQDAIDAHTQINYEVSKQLF